MAEQQKETWKTRFKSKWKTLAFTIISLGTAIYYIVTGVEVDLSPITKLFGG